MSSVKNNTLEHLSGALSSGASLGEDLVETASSQAAQFATDIAVPAATFAFSQFVRTRARQIAIGLALVIIIPIAVQSLRARRKSDDPAGSTEEVSDNATSTS